MGRLKVGRYAHPDTTAPYVGWIEPEDNAWIVFVKADHSVEAYLDRDPETGAIRD